MDPWKVQITEITLKRLKNLKDGTSGTLLSCSKNHNLFVIGIIIDSEKDFEESKLHVTGGLSINGRFQVTENENDEIVDQDTKFVVFVNPTSKALTGLTVDDCGKQFPADVTSISTAEVAKQFILLRSKIILPFSCILSENDISSQCDILRDKVTNLKIVEMETKNGNKSYNPTHIREKYSSFKDVDVHTVTVLLSMIRQKSKDDPETPNCLRISYSKKPVKVCKLSLALDTLTYCSRGDSVHSILESVSNCLQNSISLHEKCLLTQLASGNSGNIAIPETFHFFLEDAGHFLSVVYPKNKLDRDLGDIRKELHEAFALPVDRPLLMRGNSHSFEAGAGATAEAGKELINPHEAAGVSGVNGGEPVVVQGKYAYHHYCQQGMDDDGWGCAYRSLQTLASWFKLQGYTNKSVPTIKEIQQCLVSIGDKPSNFVGSRQWIGSTEVGFCLDTLLGVESRIVSVSSGDEMSMKGGELSHHFRTQGTPVMIGGGNLAHTILGVDYNRKTGDIKFLILDPHYTGGEDLNTIISKGWCGWKPLSFWKKGFFYNMCMPIRPKCI